MIQIAYKLKHPIFQIKHQN